jgi:hypothetical protein
MLIILNEPNHPIIERLLAPIRDEHARKQQEIWKRMSELSYEHDERMAKPLREDLP